MRPIPRCAVRPSPSWPSGAGRPRRSSRRSPTASARVERRWSARRPRRSRRSPGAAFALSLAGDPPAASLPVLLETLGADDGDLRWAAAGIVVRLQHERAALVESLRTLVASGNAAQRKMALYCLRDLEACTPAVEQAVLHALGDADRDVRLAAVATLARLARDRGAAAAKLVHALETGDERVRRAAAAALGALGERSAPVLAALGAASASPDPSLRRAAEGALRQLGTE